MIVLLGLLVLAIDNPRWVVIEGTRPPAWAKHATVITSYNAGRHVWQAVCLSNGGNLRDLDGELLPGCVMRIGLSPCGEYLIKAIDWSDGSTETVFLSARVDVNADGLIDSLDFFDFLAAFFRLEPRADYDGGGSVESADFFGFIRDFLECPS